MIKFAILSDLHIDIKNSSNQEKVLENIINFFESMISEGNWVDKLEIKVIYEKEQIILKSRY